MLLRYIATPICLTLALAAVFFGTADLPVNGGALVFAAEEGLFLLALWIVCIVMYVLARRDAD